MELMKYLGEEAAIRRKILNKNKLTRRIAASSPVQKK
jgi:hypothetical protein